MMRKVILSMFVTADGYVAGPENELEFFGAFAGDQTIAQDASVFLNSVDTIMLGGNAYEEFARYWPDASKDEIITGQMNEIPKVIFSRTRQQAGWGKWNNAQLIKEELSEAVLRLKQDTARHHKAMVLFGGVEIAHSFIRLGLVDEYRLLFVPMLLGTGKRLFEDGRKLTPLKFVNTKTYQSGVVRCNYQCQLSQN